MYKEGTKVVFVRGWLAGKTGIIKERCKCSNGNCNWYTILTPISEVFEEDFYFEEYKDDIDIYNELEYV